MRVVFLLKITNLDDYNDTEIEVFSHYDSATAYAQVRENEFRKEMNEEPAELEWDIHSAEGGYFYEVIEKELNK